MYTFTTLQYNLILVVLFLVFVLCVFTIIFRIKRHRRKQKFLKTIQEANSRMRENLFNQRDELSFRFFLLVGSIKNNLEFKVPFKTTDPSDIEELKQNAIRNLCQQTPFETKYEDFTVLSFLEITEEEYNKIDMPCPTCSQHSKCRGN